MLGQALGHQLKSTQVYIRLMYGPILNITQEHQHTADAKPLISLDFETITLEAV